MLTTTNPKCFFTSDFISNKKGKKKEERSFSERIAVTLLRRNVTAAVVTVGMVRRVS